MAISSFKKRLRNIFGSLYFKARPLYRKARTMYWTKKLHGKGVYCPCCQQEFARFRDFNDDNIAFYPKELGANVQCPSCSSLNRHRILCNYFSEHNVFGGCGKDDVILFAPEDSIKCWLNSNKIPFTTADLFEQDTDLNLDLMDIDLRDNSVRVIICNHVLEHVPDYKRCIGELYRILAPGGTCFLSVPILEHYAATYEDPSVVSESERKKHFGQADHLRIFGADFKAILEDSGFIVEISDGKDTKEMLRASSNGPCIYDSPKIFVCKK